MDRVVYLSYMQIDVSSQTTYNSPTHFFMQSRSPDHYNAHLHSNNFCHLVDGAQRTDSSHHHTTFSTLSVRAPHFPEVMGSYLPAKPQLAGCCYVRGKNPERKCHMRTDHSPNNRPQQQRSYIVMKCEENWNKQSFGPLDVASSRQKRDTFQ